MRVKSAHSLMVSRSLLGLLSRTHMWRTKTTIARLTTPAQMVWLVFKTAVCRTPWCTVPLPRPAKTPSPQLALSYGVLLATVCASVVVAVVRACNALCGVPDPHHPIAIGRIAPGTTPVDISQVPYGLDFAFPTLFMNSESYRD